MSQLWQYRTQEGLLPFPAIKGKSKAKRNPSRRWERHHGGKPGGADTPATSKLCRVWRDGGCNVGRTGAAAAAAASSIAATNDAPVRRRREGGGTCIRVGSGTATTATATAAAAGIIKGACQEEAEKIATTGGCVSWNVCCG